MRKNKTKISLCIFVVLAIISVSILIDLYYFRLNAGINIKPLAKYIEDHGKFPENEQILFDKEYLRILENGNDRIYQYSFIKDGKLTWNDLRGFEKYDFMYGISEDELVLIDGKLLSKKDNSSVYLISGPGMYYTKNKNYYHNLSVLLFQAIENSKN